MKRVTVFILAVFFSFQLAAQNFSITGTVVVKSEDPLPGTNIQLLSDPGNQQVRATTTGNNGVFSFRDVPSGNYILKFTFMGYGDMVKSINLNQNLSLGKLVMKEKSIMMKDAVITGESPTAVVKGDTTEISAQAYKVNPDATSEDLVAKMPGVTVDNGKVKAQGEDVKKVLVDGKQFFGDDPSAVLKNMPAEIIDKVQIFDKKSDQAEFTGFDDGNTTKTMNIVTRMPFRNGKFGRAFVGGGVDDVWKAGCTYNVFKGDMRISIIGASNNVNDQNFSIDDFLGSTTANAIRTFSSRMPGGPGGPGGNPMMGGGMSSFLVNPNSGTTKTNAIGINFNNKWKKVDFNGSYFLNYTDNENISNLTRDYFTQPYTGLNYAENSQSGTNNGNHRANFRIEYQIDSANSIIFQPRISLQNTTNLNTQAGVNREGLTLISNSDNYSDVVSDGINLSVPVLIRHKFPKKGRTISLNLTPGYNQGTSNTKLYTQSLYSQDTLVIADTVNQKAHSVKTTSSFNSSINYTEPLTETTQLQVSYSVNTNQSSSDKKTRNLTDAYDPGTLDTNLSNVFKSKYWSNNGGLSFRKHNEQINWVIGINYQQTHLTNDQTYPEVYGFSHIYDGILPNAMLQFRFTKQKSLRINYSTNINIPSVEQLQRVINNNNPLQLTTGNPDLKPEYQHSVNLRYSTSSVEKETSFFIFMNGSLNQNSISNTTLIAERDTLLQGNLLLARGSQLSMPENLDGAYNLRCFANYSIPIKKLKSKFNLNASVNYSSNPGRINKATNFSNVLSTGMGVVLSSNISEKLDFTISTTTTYNNNQNTLKSKSNSDYYQQNSKVRINAMPWKGWVLQSDLTHLYYSASGTSSVERYLLWNAAIGYKFLASKQAEIRFSVYDILEENKSINRNYTETYYEDSRSNVMQRYYMLTLSYTFKPFNFMSMMRGRGGPDGRFRPPHPPED